MKALFKKNKSFLFPYLLFLLFGGILLLTKSKADIHLLLNSLCNNYLDHFFLYITFLGDGFAIGIAVLILLLIRYRFAILVGISYIFSSIITQILKHTLFSGEVRPKKFFEGIHELYFIQGEDNHLFNSFPSGHATSAFALFFCFTLISKNNFLKFILFIIALIVGYSRVYLSQHFFADIYAGSLIGVGISFLVFHFMEQSKKIHDKTWIDKSLINRS